MQIGNEIKIKSRDSNIVNPKNQMMKVHLLLVGKSNQMARIHVFLSNQITKANVLLINKLARWILLLP